MEKKPKTTDDVTFTTYWKWLLQSWIHKRLTISVEEEKQDKNNLETLHNMNFRVM